MTYRNIVFDVGHVLLSYRWEQMMIDYGLSEEEANAFHKMMFLDPLWNEFDLENWSYEEVGEKFVEKNPGHEAAIRYFLTHREEMAVARPGVYERAAKLKQAGYRLYILSNYSSVLFASHTKKIPIMDQFDGMVVSSQIHIGKPDERIYEELFSRYGLQREECLFFDDRMVNVEGARHVGMDAILVTSEEMLEGELDRLLEEADVF